MTRLAITSLSVMLIFRPLAVHAAGLAITCPGGSCQIADFLQQLIVLTRYGLYLVTLLGVLMFIYAGFQFITAGGRSSKIDEGKRIILGTFVGLVISFTAFIIINTTILALTGTSVRPKDFFAGVIGTLFTGQSIQINGVDTPINRPFSGETTGDSNNKCRGSNETLYDKSCDVGSLHIFCADSAGDSNGSVLQLQNQLLAVGCTCVTADGC